MDFDEALSQVEPAPRPEKQPDLPKGWEPGIKWSNATDSGEIVTEALESEPDEAIWKELIDDWGLDSNLLEIVDGSIELIGWDSSLKGVTPEMAQAGVPTKQRLKRYKARLRRRVLSDSEVDRADVDALCEWVLTKPSRPTPAIPHISEIEHPRSMVVPCADWQIGKGEGDGSEGTFNRIMESIDKVIDRIQELNLLGRGPDVVYLVGMGDLIEQCRGHYSSQTFQVDLNRRQQMRVVRRLFMRFVDLLVDEGVSVVVSGVPGNHGENRDGSGKAYTDITDNDDLAVIEQCAEVWDSNDRYKNVTVVLANDYAITLDISGVPVAFFHGHVTKGGANAQKKMEDWWTGQVMGNRPTVRDARILVTAHYHHLACSESSGRTWMQCPAMDPGSHWWTSLTGQHSQSGMITFCVGDWYGVRGWGDFLVC